MAYQPEPAQFERRQELMGEARETAATAPPQRGLTVAAALAVMAVFAAGLWFAYYAGTRNSTGADAGAVPLIRADARPMMVRPTAPGGLKIPDRNMLIFDPGRPMAERLLPQPEEPLAPPGPGAGATAAAPPRPGETPGEKPIPPAADTRGAPPPASGRVRLQLGSLRSAEAARREWVLLRSHNRDLFGGLAAAAVRVNLGKEGVYYRIESGPLSEGAAARVCAALKQRKLGCIIVR
jgi:sporulation related protein